MAPDSNYVAFLSIVQSESSTHGALDEYLASLFVNYLERVVNYVWRHNRSGQVLQITQHSG